MPNYCDNDFVVSGPQEAVSRVVELLAGDNGVVDFNGVTPYPEEWAAADKACREARDAWLKLPVKKRPPHSALPEDGYNRGGYQWCVANWGTKWNACDPFVDDDRVDPEGNRTVRYTFQTAWSPPSPVIQKLGEMFSNVRFQLNYYEAGMGFCGVLVCSEGSTEMDLSGNYDGDRGG